MKKITLLFLLSAFIGYSQSSPITFDTDVTVGTNWIDAGIDVALVDVNDASIGGPTPTITPPASPSGMVGRLITRAGGDPWQEAHLITTTKTIDLTTATGGAKTVTMDVYSTTGNDFLLKVINGLNGAGNSEVPAAHNGTGWERLTFDFTNATVGGVPDGEYRTFAIFSLYDISMGLPGGFIGSAGMSEVTTTAIDNVTFVEGSDIPPSISYSQDFETSPTVIDFDGCTATVEAPSGSQATGNSSTNLAKLVRNGGQVWAGAAIQRPEDFDFSTERYIQLRIWTDAPIDTPILLKTEEIGNGANNNSGDKIVRTTVTGDWETLTFDFSGTVATNHRQLVIIPNIGTLGNGSSSSTYYFDDIVQTATASTNDKNVIELEAYPNPTQDRWNIRTTQIINSVEVYDILGKQVLSLNPKSTEVEIDAKNLKSGLYFAKVNAQEGSSTLKLVRK